MRNGAIREFASPDAGSKVAVGPGRPPSSHIAGHHGVRILGPAGDDLVRVDPLDVLLGNLKKLNLDTGEPGIGALGAILLVYLKLKLRLQIAGFKRCRIPSIRLAQEYRGARQAARQAYTMGLRRAKSIS